MREIKFRGWDEQYKTWIFGDLKLNEAGDKAIITPRKDGYLVPCSVDRNSVGQFTGLCDCKGQDIYEGDVVAFGDFFREHDVKNEYWHGVVKWSPEGARFVLDKLEFDEDVCSDELLVIGNVHDNPDLLEATHD